MIKRATISLIIICISIVLGKALNNWMLPVKICGSIGLVCFGLAIILNDVFIRRDRLISNNCIDRVRDKKIRSKITNFVMFVGSTNTVLAIVVFFIIK
jgi:hypothetical protein